MDEEPVSFTDHAIWQAERRALDLEAVIAVAREPEQIVTIRKNREVRQSRTPDGYLLRVIVEVSEVGLTVVTMYRTSKIEKYWTP